MMTELRLLKIRSTSDYFGHVTLPRDFEFPSYELRYLYWEGYPLESLPSKFHGTHLIELSMHYSLVKELWRGDEVKIIIYLYVYLPFYNYQISHKC